MFPIKSKVLNKADRHRAIEAVSVPADVSEVIVAGLLKLVRDVLEVVVIGVLGGELPDVPHGLHVVRILDDVWLELVPLPLNERRLGFECFYLLLDGDLVAHFIEVLRLSRALLLLDLFLLVL